MKHTFLLPALFFSAVLAYAQPGQVNSGNILKQGSEYADAGEFAKAIESYKTVHPSDTNYYVAQEELGYAALQAKDWDAALASADIVLKQNPKHHPSVYITQAQA